MGSKCRSGVVQLSKSDSFSHPEIIRLEYKQCIWFEILLRSVCNFGVFFELTSQLHAFESPLPFSPLACGVAEFVAPCLTDVGLSSVGYNRFQL